MVILMFRKKKPDWVILVGLTIVTIAGIIWNYPDGRMLHGNLLQDGVLVSFPLHLQDGELPMKSS